MRQFNQLPNGDLWYPDSTNPPPAPKGYLQNPNKSYYYHLLIKECSYRFITKEKLCCNKSKNIIYCDNFEKEVSPLDCKTCEV